MQRCQPGIPIAQLVQDVIWTVRCAYWWPSMQPPMANVDSYLISSKRPSFQLHSTDATQRPRSTHARTFPRIPQRASPLLRSAQNFSHWFLEPYFSDDNECTGYLPRPTPCLVRLKTVWNNDLCWAKNCLPRHVILVDQCVSFGVMESHSGCLMTEPSSIICSVL